jgi:hypothetical protein
MNTARAECILDKMELQHIEQRRVLAALWACTSDSFSGSRPFWQRWLLRLAYKQLIPAWLWDQQPMEANPSTIKRYIKGKACDALYRNA